MKILLQTVGTGGSENPVWQALAYTIQSQGPFDLVVFLCSAKTANETVPKIRAECASSGLTAVQVEVVESPDPEHLPNLTAQYIRLIEDLGKRHPGTLIHTDFTSGTKAMSAAIVAASVITNATMVHYATGPRDQAGRAYVTDRVVSLPTSTLVAERELPELSNIFNLHQYAAAEIWAKRIQVRLPDGMLKDRAASMERMARVCKEWDRFNFKQALHQLNESTKRERHIELLANAGWNVNWMQAAKQHLERCEATKGKTPITHEWLIDLAQNAARCHARGEYDNAVARRYRLVEAIGQHLLGEHLGLMDSSDVPRTRVESIARSLPALRKSTETTLKLGSHEVFELLAGSGCELGTVIHRDWKDVSGLRGLLSSRNSSLLAHGFAPVGESTSAKLARSTEKYLRQLLGDTFDAMQGVATFPRCPWSPSLNPWTEFALGSQQA